MQRYAILDTKNFNCQCSIVEHQSDRLVILENRQYLPSTASDAWQTKLPQILEHIAHDFPNTEFIFLLPDAAVIHLTLELPVNSKNSIRENIAHTLYKNFKLSPQKYYFQFVHLDENRYMVSLVTKKFLNCVREAIGNRFKSIKIFPFFTGQFAYIQALPTEPSGIIIFIEKHLRRFFIHTATETNFIDFYQPQENSFNDVSDIHHTQQFISQTLNVPEGEKKLFLIGDISDGLKELYATEYGTPPETQTDTTKILGCTEKISEVAQCAYWGINSIINGNASHLNTFDFCQVPVCNCQKFLTRWKKPLSIVASIGFLLSTLFFARELQQHFALKEKNIQLNLHKNTIEHLQTIHNYLTEKEQQSTLLPQILLNYCYLLQTLPGHFCIDHLGFGNTDEQNFCSIRGRIYKEKVEIFKRTLRERLHHKVDFYAEPSDETIDNFSIRIPLNLPPILS